MKFCLIMILYLIFLVYVDHCSIGMKVYDSRIQNNQTSASSFYSSIYHQYHGRFDLNINQDWESKQGKFWKLLLNFTFEKGIFKQTSLCSSKTKIFVYFQSFLVSISPFNRCKFVKDYFSCSSNFFI